MSDSVKPRVGGDADRASQGRVLLVDSDRLLLRAYEHCLSSAGLSVTTLEDARLAATILAQGGFDVVIGDPWVAEAAGVDLAREVHGRDPSVPVLLMSFAPAAPTGPGAALGPVRHLGKPLALEELKAAVTGAVARRRAAQAGRARTTLLGMNACAEEPLERRFERAFEQLWIATQPIVDCSTRSVLGYEAFVCSQSSELRDATSLFAAATRLERVTALGRRIRTLIASTLPPLPSEAHLFVNLHPHDLLDEDLLAGRSDFAASAGRCVLELSDRARLGEIPHARARIEALRVQGFRIAIDDLGAGHAGLAGVAQFEPDFVKVDLSLVRDVDRRPGKAHLVGAIMDACRRMGVVAVAEGVETVAERDALVRLGCDHMQGYLFARPGPPHPAPAW